MIASFEHEHVTIVGCFGPLSPAFPLKLLRQTIPLCEHSALNMYTIKQTITKHFTVNANGMKNVLFECLNDKRQTLLSLLAVYCTLFGLPFTASQYCFGKVFPV